MPPTVSAIRQGLQTVTPYIIVRDAERAIAFYVTAFGATEVARTNWPDGKIAHAEIQLGSSRLMLGDERRDMNRLSPETLGGSPISLYVYVEDCDEVFAQATAAGAKTVRPLNDEFYGDRAGVLLDPFGLTWTIATHVEDVSRDEMLARMAKMFA